MGDTHSIKGEQALALPGNRQAWIGHIRTEEPRVDGIPEVKSQGVVVGVDLFYDPLNGTRDVYSRLFGG